MTKHDDFSESYFLEAYFRTAIWSSIDDNGDPLDRNYDTNDIDEGAYELMSEKALMFMNRVSPMISEIAETYPDERGSIWEQIGHDLWLTQNGHGTGFWDKPEIYGSYTDTLTALSKSVCDPIDLYLGDDGKIYFM